MEKNTIIDNFKLAIDSENLTAQFYKYIADNTKNGNIKKSFYEISNEAKTHEELLKKRLAEITDEPYETNITSYKKSNKLCPSSFTIIGAINVAQTSEAESIKFYKEMLKDKTDKANQELFKFILDQEKKHLRLLKKQKEFLQIKETFHPTRGIDFQAAISKLWK